MKYYSAIKKNEILPFENNIDRPRGYYAKWNKADRERKYCVISLICGILKNK